MAERLTFGSAKVPENQQLLRGLAEPDLVAALKAPAPLLLDFPEDHEDSGTPRRAAVLVPFIRRNDSWEIVYIRRAESTRDRHSGQVAFAGGMWEPQDTSLQKTALREAREEIGLHPDVVRLLGELPVHRSIAGVEIKPIIGIMPWPYPLQPQAVEVARVFTIPLDWLATPDNFEVVELTSLGERRSGRSVSYREFDGERLWGATARMTLTLVSNLMNYCGQPLPRFE